MAERKKKDPPEAEVEVVEERVSGTVAGPLHAETGETGDGGEAFNQHVKDLVALFAQEQLQALEQRVADLEMLVGQPEGAVTFEPQRPSQYPDLDDVPEYKPASRATGEVPWF